MLESIASKARATKISEAKMKAKTPLESCVNRYLSNGQQNNKWRLFVYRAVSKGITFNTITREIRREKGSCGWDGTWDTECRNIQKKVKRAYKAGGSEGKLDVKELKSISRDDRRQVMIRKHPSMSKSLRGKPVSTSEQDKMEEELFKYVQDLRERNLRVTRMLILRKAIEIYPLFLG